MKRKLKITLGIKINKREKNMKYDYRLKTKIFENDIFEKKILI